MDSKILFLLHNFNEKLNLNYNKECLSNLKSNAEDRQGSYNIWLNVGIVTMYNSLINSVNLYHVWL